MGELWSVMSDSKEWERFVVWSSAPSPFSFSDSGCLLFFLDEDFDLEEIDFGDAVDIGDFKPLVFTPAFFFLRRCDPVADEDVGLLGWARRAEFRWCGNEDGLKVDWKLAILLLGLPVRREGEDMVMIDLDGGSTF